MEESISLLTLIKKSFDLKEVDIRTYSPLTLAYIGDAVYDLIFRTDVVLQGNTSANKLHNKTVQYVKAPAQARLIESIMEELSEEELAVYKRGRNAKPYTMAKNATMGEYKKATGLEALVGYLYLTDQMDRVLQLIQKGLHNAEDKEEHEDKQ
ncbi:MAG: ribonuclease III [Lachnospiraceae bacterium]|nr:ribonuclease III [Lachnospiraceae bacterium]